MKTQLLTASFLSLCIGVSAQSISPEVIASSGEHFEAGNAQLSWTIGEPMIETYTAGSNMLTQGFHQTELMITSIEEENTPNLQVDVYPNPVRENVNIDLKGNEEELQMDLYDMKGKQLINKQISPQQGRVSLDFGSYAQAYYFLKIYSKDGSVNHHYKIEKVQ